MEQHTEPEAPARDGGVADRDSGEIRVLEDRCSSCVLNPAHRAIPLPAGRRRSFIEQARAADDGYVVCHSTFGDGIPPGTRPAMCRGFVDAYGLPPIVQEAVAVGIARLVDVPDPMAAAKDLPEQEQPWYRSWLETGTLECADCRTRVRCDNLESLPQHHCTERQRARRAAAG
ncbi:hypothetical protein ACIPW5_33845 [Streptomyces sp. NPDC090077]|uniref:hypothetical protein n=1 Tax=Streptomyces sp. NPDC090077 TaxID=3365938 RepID=UPI00382422F5